MATRYWVGGSGTWDNSTTTNWSTTSGGSGGASVPGSSDQVIIDGNSGSSFTLTVGSNLTVNCFGINWASSSLSTLQAGGPVSTTFIQVNGGNIIGSGGANVDVGWIVNGTVHLANGDSYNGSLWTFGGTSTLVIGTTSSSGDREVIKIPDIPQGNTLNLNGNECDLFGGCTVEGTIVLNGGTLVLELSGSYSIDTFGTLTVDTGTVNIGANFSMSGGSLSAASGTIILTNGTAAFGGNTIGALIVGGTCTITGSNSFGTFSCPAAAGYAGNSFQPLGNVTITLAHGSTQTITTASGLSLVGDASDVITINSDSSGVQANFSMASGTCAAAYLSLKDNNAEGGATFKAVNSSIVSNVTGWLLGSSFAPRRIARRFY